MASLKRWRKHQADILALADANSRDNDEDNDTYSNLESDTGRGIVIYSKRVVTGPVCYVYQWSHE